MHASDKLESILFLIFLVQNLQYAWMDQKQPDVTLRFIVNDC